MTPEQLVEGARAKRFKATDEISVSKTSGFTQLREVFDLARHGKWEGVAEWVVLEKGKEEQGPFTLWHLAQYLTKPGIQIRHKDSSDWKPFENFAKELLRQLRKAMETKEAGENFYKDQLAALRKARLTKEAFVGLFIILLAMSATLFGVGWVTWKIGAFVVRADFLAGESDEVVQSENPFTQQGPDITAAEKAAADKRSTDEELADGLSIFQYAMILVAVLLLGALGFYCGPETLFFAICCIGYVVIGNYVLPLWLGLDGPGEELGWSQYFAGMSMLGFMGIVFTCIFCILVIAIAIPDSLPMDICIIPGFVSFLGFIIFGILRLVTYSWT